MISFRQFLVEMPTKINWDKEANQWPSNYRPSPGSEKKVFSTKDHHFYKAKAGKDYGNDGYMAVHRKTGNVHMTVSGHHEGKHFYVNTLIGSKDSTIKAHEFYHHLLNHGLHLHSSNAQSPGGQKTWQRLADKPDVAMKHRGGKEGPRFIKNLLPNRGAKKLDLHKGADWDKNYYAGRETDLGDHYNSRFHAKKKGLLGRMFGK